MYSQSYGNADWEKIRSLADKYNLKIPEDSADIIGAKYKGQPTGKFSDISITSFYGMRDQLLVMVA